MAAGILQPVLQVLDVAAESNQADGAATPRHVRDGRNQHIAGADIGLLGVVDQILGEDHDVADAVVDQQHVHALQGIVEVGDVALHWGFRALLGVDRRFSDVLANIADAGGQQQGGRCED